MVARAEAGSGPALRASAISASRGIMNSVIAGYFFSIWSGGGAWVCAAAAEAPASSKTSETASLLPAPPRRAWVAHIRMAVFSLYCSRRRLGETHREARQQSGSQPPEARRMGGAKGFPGKFFLCFLGDVLGVAWTKPANCLPPHWFSPVRARWSCWPRRPTSCPSRCAPAPRAPPCRWR